MIHAAFFILAILILIVSENNLNKGFILFLGFRLILNFTIGLSFVPGLPNIQLEMLLCIYYIYKYNKSKGYLLGKNPLHKCINFLAITMTLSSIFTEGEITSELMRCFNNLVRGYLFIYPLWLFSCNFKEKDKPLFAKTFIIGIAVVILYSLFCLRIGDNPLISFEDALSGVDLSESGYMDENSLRGIRWSSIFLHPIGCGVNCVYLLGVLLYIYYFCNIYNRLKGVLLIVLCIGLLFVILQTKSRTPMIGFALLLLPLVLQFKNKSIIIAFITIVILGINFLDDVSLTLISSLTQDKVSEVGGSDTNMRQQQLLGVLYFMQNHPILGYGAIGTEKVMTAVSKYELYGIESIWFSTGLAYGFVGILALVLLYWTMLRIKIRTHKYDCLSIVVAFILMNTFTSIPDQKEYLVFLLLFLYMKENKLLPV
jgi:hypothetical protein